MLVVAAPTMMIECEEEEMEGEEESERVMRGWRVILARFTNNQSNNQQHYYNNIIYYTIIITSRFKCDYCEHSECIFKGTFNE